jgi:mono/diheme cytochrome c family protein
LTFLLVAWHIRQVHHLGVAPAWVRVGDEDAVPKTQRLHPDHTFRIAIGAIIFTALLLWLAARYPAPLEPRANPLDTAYKPHPDFYVLWLHELLKLFPPDWEFVGSFVLPTVLVILLLAVPFLDRSPERHPLQRLPAITTGLTVLFAIIALNIKGMEALPKPEHLSPLERRGRELFVELRCYSCHGINGGGGPVGPDLGLGGKRDPKKVEAILRNPSAFNAHTVMPAYHLPPDDMKALVAYIVSLGPHSRMPPIPPVEPEKPPSHFEDNWLITHKFEVRKDQQSCQSCHKPFFSLSWATPPLVSPATRLAQVPLRQRRRRIAHLRHLPHARLLRRLPSPHPPRHHLASSARGDLDEVWRDQTLRGDDPPPTLLPMPHPSIVR